MASQQIDFVAAGVYKSDFTKIQEGWDEKSKDFNWDGIPPKPLRSLLITPSLHVAKSGKIQEYLYDLKDKKDKEEIEKIIFDPGIHQIDSKYSSDELLELNKNLYSQLDWADYYLLQTNSELENLENIISDNLKLYERLPEKIQQKVVPVLQANHLDDIDLQLEKYKDLHEQANHNLVSFACVSNKIRKSSKHIFLNNLLILDRIKSKGFQAHHLGTGNPAFVFVLKYLDLNVDSYDNTTWIRSAGFNCILFPYHQTIELKKKNGKSRIHLIETQQDLDKYKEKVSHDNPFCKSLEELQESRTVRALHNLVVYDQLNSIYERDNMDLEKLKEASPDYYNLILEFQDKTELPLFN